MLASLFSKKASFAGFQALEFPSGVEATPTSPIAPARESGLTNRIGTAVVTTLYFRSFCAYPLDANASKKRKRMCFFIIYCACRSASLTYINELFLYSRRFSIQSSLPIHSGMIKTWCQSPTWNVRNSKRWQIGRISFKYCILRPFPN